MEFDHMFSTKPYPVETSYNFASLLPQPQPLAHIVTIEGETISPTPEEARTLLESQSAHDLKQSTLYAVRDLARALQGGKKADPDVSYPSRLAARLEVQFMALSLALPLRQTGREGNRPTDPDWADLGSVLSSVSRDARYLKRLCNYGWVPDNVVEPIRVVREIRAKLDVVQRLAPADQSTTFLAA